MVGTSISAPETATKEPRPKVRILVCGCLTKRLLDIGYWLGHLPLLRDIFSLSANASRAGLGVPSKFVTTMVFHVYNLKWGFGG